MLNTILWTIAIASITVMTLGMLFVFGVLLTHVNK